MYIPRASQHVIAASIMRPYITAIIGPRRVGKSSFILHYAEHHPQNKWVFLNMDKMAQREQVEKQQLARLISEYGKQTIDTNHKLWVVIDEAQKCPEIFDQIKIIYDAYKDKNKIKFIITGSAVLSLHQLSAESLAGRIEIYHLYEFNLHESTLLHEPNLPMHSIFDTLTSESAIPILSHVINELAPFRPILENQLALQLIWGGLPELLIQHSDEEKIIYLHNYLQTYLEKDIRAIETISDLSLYRNMLEVMAEQTGSVRNDQQIIQALHCKRDTLKKYRGYLEATLLYLDIYPFISSSLKRFTKSPKGYLLNNGLVSLLTGLTHLVTLEKTGVIGHRVENWFLNELNSWLARLPTPSSIQYWRTSTGAEVDFIVIKKPEIFPFEVTYSKQVDQRKIRHLLSFLQNEPKAKWGYYIYRGEFKI